MGSRRQRQYARIMDTGLRIGTRVDSPAVPAALHASKFNRHTFWCGQSGSGKTYALGVVLEQILLTTHLPLLVIDPNGDYVRLGDPVGSADPSAGARLAQRDIRILRPGGRQGDPLHVRYRDLSVRSRAAVLRLDPLIDAEEYNALLRVHSELPDTGTQEALIQALESSDEPARKRLLLRIENLGLFEWELWARGDLSAEDVIDERPDGTVLDLGGFQRAEESLVAALAVFDRLWAQRHSRNPLLIVIDEAHNLCPPDPTTPVGVLLTERIIQIAAEGRKYGLWLLLSTQRPTKIHPNVLSQCDNLGLMKLTSPRDLAELADMFGFAPPSMLAQATGFAQGEALFAGGFIDQPSIVRIGQRLTHEGGADVKVPL